MGLDEVLERLDKELTPKAPNDQPPGPLFHYTDATGFHAIFANRVVWATDFRYLNDAEEVRIGERNFREVAEELLAGAVSDRQRFILRQIIDHHDEKSLSKVISPCVASFSETGDLLSQWRAYAAGGAGYSIGFTGFPLPTGPSSTAHVALGLFRCEYEVQSYRYDVRAALTRLATSYEETVKEYSKDQESDGRIGGLFIALGLRHAAALVARLKHRAFREEQEWRLVCLPKVGHEKDVLEYRSSVKGLVPYIPLQLASGGERLQVSRVYVGPTQAPDEGVAGARGFLAGLGYEPGIVLPSEIPFRGR